MCQRCTWGHGGIKAASWYLLMCCWCAWGQGVVAASWMLAVALFLLTSGHSGLGAVGIHPAWLLAIALFLVALGHSVREVANFLAPPFSLSFFVVFSAGCTLSSSGLASAVSYVCFEHLLELHGDSGVAARIRGFFAGSFFLAALWLLAVMLPQCLMLA